MSHSKGSQRRSHSNKVVRTLSLLVAISGLSALLVLGCGESRPGEGDTRPPTTISGDDLNPNQGARTFSHTGMFGHKASIAKGETLDLYISSAKRGINLRFLRLGKDTTEVEFITRIPVSVQTNNSFLASRTGVDWTKTVSVEIGEDWPTGFYLAVEDPVPAPEASLPELQYKFVVREADSAPAPQIAVMANTNTWHAYGNWGGCSFYSCSILVEGQVPSNDVVSYRRPETLWPLRNDPTSHTAEAEVLFYQWLERNNYSYELFSDVDLHEGNARLLAAKVIIITVHSEYWSKEMRDNIEAFQNRGGHLIILSGNTMYREVRFVGTEFYAMQRIDEWVDQGRPEAPTIGLAYDDRGYDTWAGYKVLAPTHWIFNGTNTELNAIIGKESYRGKAASGLETDKITSDSPANLVHLAKGINPDNGGADMIYVELPSGAKLFNAGSIFFVDSLVVDWQLTQMVKNLIDNFVQ